VAPDAVVTTGPYAYVRHPNYAIVIVELFALPLVHGAWITCAACTALNAIVLASRIPAEERVLSAIPGYREAMGDKPRFVPRLRGR
jgi:methyltransferase